MLDIWNACKDYDVFTGDIEERIVAQMLFTKSSDKRLTDVFDSYVKMVDTGQLLRPMLHIMLLCIL